LNPPLKEIVMQVQPYLMFEGRCEEAIEFYKKAIGAEVQMLMRFKDAPVPPQGERPMGSPEKVMHASIKIGDSIVNASDGECGGKANFGGFSLVLNCKDAAEAEKYFGALSQGGQVRMPLSPTFFSPKFGMLADKFGLGWMVIVQK
jgi:PhnB protein